MALLDSPDAGTSRRGKRCRCRFELVEGVDVIVPLVVLIRSLDPLCARDKSRVAIYGTVNVIPAKCKARLAFLLYPTP